MMTRMIHAYDIARFVRAGVIACALLTMLMMQGSVLMHAFEHMGAAMQRVSIQSGSVDKVSVLNMQILNMQILNMQTPLEASALSAGNDLKATTQDDSPRGVTCQKCLEDLAHAFILTAPTQLTHADMSYALVHTALPHNLPRLSPERANQRGPPLIS